MGYSFSSNVNGKITALWIYSGGGSKTLKLWSGNGALLKTIVVSNSSYNVWAEGVLAEPYVIAAGTQYAVSASLNDNGRYIIPSSFPITIGNIVISSGKYSASGFPSLSGTNIYME